MITEQENSVLKQKLTVAYISWILDIGKTAIIQYVTHYPGNVVSESDLLNSISTIQLHGSQRYTFDQEMLQIIVSYNNQDYRQQINLESVVTLSIMELNSVVVKFEVEAQGMNQILTEVRKEKKWKNNKGEVDNTEKQVTREAASVVDFASFKNRTKPTPLAIVPTDKQGA